jgi:hypothetical protein
MSKQIPSKGRASGLGTDELSLSILMFCSATELGCRPVRVVALSGGR